MNGAVFPRSQRNTLVGLAVAEFSGALQRCSARRKRPAVNPIHTGGVQACGVQAVMLVSLHDVQDITLQILFRYEPWFT
ncbi:hypothetical protein D3C81_1784470 [compost metagenome]